MLDTHSSDILAKYAAAFCLCLKNFPDPDAELKGNELISLLEEISRETIIDSAV